MEFPQKWSYCIQFIQSWNALLRVFSLDLSEFDLSETLLEPIVRINPGMGVINYSVAHRRTFLKDFR